MCSSRIFTRKSIIHALHILLTKIYAYEKCHVQELQIGQDFLMRSMSKKLCEIKLDYTIVNFDNKFKLTISKLNKHLKTYPALKKTRNLFTN
jgi:hypothetical protein